MDYHQGTVLLGQSEQTQRSSFTTFLLKLHEGVSKNVHSILSLELLARRTALVLIVCNYPSHFQSNFLEMSQLLFLETGPLPVHEERM